MNEEIFLELERRKRNSILKDKISQNDLIDINTLIRNEMKQRSISFSFNDDLDKKSEKIIIEYPQPKMSEDLFVPKILKPNSGFEKFEFSDPKKLWDNWYSKYCENKELIIESKWDGFAFSIYKDGDKVKLITEDKRRDRAHLFPQIVKEILSIPVKKFVLVSEVLLFSNNVPIPREEAIKLIVGKESMEKEDIRLFVYDITNYDGENIHKLPFSSRLKYLHKLLPKNKVYIKTSNKIIVKSYIELLNAYRQLKEVPGSEGIMAKRIDFPYELDGRTPLMSKVKESRDIEVEVKKKNPKINSEGKVIPGEFIYDIIIRGEKNEEIPIGRTFSTSIDAKTGEILKVRTARIRGFYDPTNKKIIKFTLMWPKVLDKSNKKKPISFEQISKIAWIPKIEKKQLSENLQYVLQHHYRGSSVHTDFRFSINDHLLGFTLNDAEENKFLDLIGKHWKLEKKEGKRILYWDNEIFYEIDKNGKLLKKSSTELNRKVYDYHKQLENKYDLWKINWKTGEEKSRTPTKDLIPKTEGKVEKIFCELKSLQPKNWLKMDGITYPREIQEEPGGTRYYPGVFIKFNSGTYETGAQKPYFKEFFLDKFGRIVFRLVSKIGEKQKNTWLYWKPDSQIPYMLTSRAVKTRTMPPVNQSWLPTEWKKKIPKDLRYWEGNSNRFEKLKAAVEYVKKITKSERLEERFIKNKHKFLEELEA